VGRLLGSDRAPGTRGAAAVEYALMIGVIAAVIAAAVLGLSAQAGAGPNRFCSQTSSNGFGCGPGSDPGPAPIPPPPWSENCPSPTPSASATTATTPTDTEIGEPDESASPCAGPD
jgi:hypothetical protein